MQQAETRLNSIIWWSEQRLEPEPLLIYNKQLEQLVRIEQSMQEELPRVVIVMGKRGCGKKFLMLHAAGRIGKHLLLVDTEALYQCCLEEGGETLKILSRMLTDQQARLCLVAGELEEKEEQWRELYYGLVLEHISFYQLTDRRVCMPAEGSYVQVTLDLPAPDLRDRAVLWEYFLKKYPVSPSLQPEVLAGKYMLHTGGILRVLMTAAVCQVADAQTHMTDAHIAAAVRQYQHENFGPFATLVPAVFTWEQLVVPEETRQKLRQVCSQVRYRNLVGNIWGFYETKPHGRGISALFCGPSGTGKTMAAQIIANDLGLSLYRVDLSQMMSKYIGETQKNISSLFERAADMNVVLLFDEADSFFSRRTNVKDAHDRHSNGEIAHLLQQMEAYEGVAILTTNLKDHLDDAFRRRIKLTVEFQLPGQDQRRVLWRNALPAKAPVSPEVRLDFYADQFELSGSEIQETMVNAAFLAAAEGKVIGRSQINEALRNCYLKYGKLLLDEELAYDWEKTKGG